MAAPPRRLRSRVPLRILTAVPLCDGHDSAIMTINQELTAAGAEVVYLGYHQSASAIARAAVQEDVQAVGISSYNGGHLVFFREVIAQLRGRGGSDIRVFGGGGGTITPADARALQRSGVERIFFAGTGLDEIVRAVSELAGGRASRRARPGAKGDRASDQRLARDITLTEAGARRLSSGAHRRRGTVAGCFVLGVAGPGGAGKSTLIDELTSRFLRERGGRVAILANDPSHPHTGGALLGDRVSAIYAQHDRVFFRSLATRGSLTGVSSATTAAVDVLVRSGEFELVIVESVGIGQESDPFGSLRGDAFVDAVVFVTPPHYGGKIQLEKTALLHRADLVVLNKCDDPRSATAKVEISAALARRPGPPPLHLTVAAKHHDGGVDALYAAITELAGLEPTGGERACQLRVHT